MQWISSPACGKLCLLRNSPCKEAYPSHTISSTAGCLAALAESSNSAVALTQRQLGHACRGSCCVTCTIQVCMMQIMELENARTEAQAEARSLAAELESLRSEEPADSSGVCHTHSAPCKRSGAWLPGCACIAAGSCQKPQLQTLCRTGPAVTGGCHTIITSSTIPALILVQLAMVLQGLAWRMSWSAKRQCKPL